ncbi:hypothetical protein [Aestuariicoccus sp. MJ-SS9]|uniref:hypothetical protein n=1 Tax=Aestuariicoccus sp. MJ-SS9 TaxID=3079855 RepID=UPI0039776B67
MESFTVRFRDDLLDRESFCALREARIIIQNWRRHWGLDPNPCRDRLRFRSLQMPYCPAGECRLPSRAGTTCRTVCSWPLLRPACCARPWRALESGRAPIQTPIMSREVAVMKTSMSLPGS